jgi:hypothetical protein
MFSRAIISALSLFLAVNAQQQTPYQLDCDTTDLTSPPSTNLDDWVNSLLTVLHNNGKTAFEEVLVGFAATEDGYDVLEGMWESTANGGKGESWSLLIPSNEVSIESDQGSQLVALNELPHVMFILIRPLLLLDSLPLTLNSMRPPSTLWSLTTPCLSPYPPPSLLPAVPTLAPLISSSRPSSLSLMEMEA